MKEIRQVFNNSKENCDLQQQEEINCFVTELEGFKLSDDTVLKDGEKSILFYIPGYIAKCIAKMHCEDCNQLFTPGKISVEVSFENSDDHPDDPTLRANEAKEEFVNSVSRGGLRKPLDFVYIACAHASALNRYIFNSEEIKSSLLTTKNPWDTFMESFVTILKITNIR